MERKFAFVVRTGGDMPTKLFGMFSVTPEDEDGEGIEDAENKAAKLNRIANDAGKSQFSFSVEIDEDGSLYKQYLSEYGKSKTYFGK